MQDVIELQGAGLTDTFSDYFISFADTSKSDANLSYMTAKNRETIFREMVSMNIATFL